MCELGKVLVPMPTDASNPAITERIQTGVTLDAYVDPCQMSQCRYFIIANSAFGWWGCR
jgi:hypothetical protein